MGIRRLLWFVGLVGLALWNPACTDSPYIFGRCSVTQDCRSWYNYLGGTLCMDTYCMCPDPGDEICCPDGGQDCPWDEYACRSEFICQAGINIVKIAPGDSCTTDEQCRDPVEKRCGPPVCSQGRCAYAGGVLEPLKSQYPGDCKTEVCTFDGDIEKRNEGSDLPWDGNECTFDMCEKGEPFHKPWPDGFPHPSFGVCISGIRFDCSELLNFIECPGTWFCDWDTCVPAYCKNGILSPAETGVDCGGPDCRGCDIGVSCLEGRDCESGVCEGGACQAPTHTDGAKNEFETGVDCGYPGGFPFRCKDGEGCLIWEDCESQVCYQGICQPPNCSDTRMNGTETQVDCGGPCPPCK